MHRGKDAVRLLPGPASGSERSFLCPMLALRYGTMVDQGSKRAHPAGCDRPDAQAGMAVIVDNVRTISLFSYNICVNSTVRAPRFPDVHGATARALAPDRATPWNFNEPLALCPGSQHLEREGKMAVNKPTGDNARKGAVKKRSQTKTTLGSASAWTKRNKGSGEFMALKRPGKTKKAAKKFKGVRVEKKAAKGRVSKKKTASKKKSRKARAR